MISAEVGPPRRIVAAWITQRQGSSPAPGGDGAAELDRRQLVALGLDRGPAGARDRAGDAAAVAQLGVRRVRDRVDLERGDVGVEDLDRGHRGHASAALSAQRRRCSTRRRRRRRRARAGGGTPSSRRRKAAAPTRCPISTAGTQARASQASGSASAASAPSTSNGVARQAEPEQRRGERVAQGRAAQPEPSQHEDDRRPLTLTEVVSAPAAKPPPSSSAGRRSRLGGRAGAAERLERGGADHTTTPTSELQADAVGVGDDPGADQHPGDRRGDDQRDRPARDLDRDGALRTGRGS